ncbi:sensor domain-containing diguanylate cyclase [Pseudoxanthomonas suwonensis]|uniref:diguanylate cyclase n=1 Tax=Pseudoxanthomonas suwonensis TaxID=314722 RepID=A0A0E3YYY5_9GAMM|nr:sensor domain-containing diguanylate cyclase [Pseudoxanthomonas suwonensis]AKC85648.1 diguanylate cyclase [Pseudoxanthomonas suwonensis]
MLRPAKPDNESERLAALRATRLLDTPREQAFDDLVKLATSVSGTAMGAVTLVDEDRQWFKARQGFDLMETPREESFCAHAILEPQRLMLVEDTLQDTRFAGHPAVTGELGVRFYAGIPLLDGDGMALGSLCVFDSRPGTLSEAQADALRALARQAAHLIELRGATRALDRHMRDRDWYEQQLAQYSDLLEQQNADLAEQTRTDPLTGLPNRRAFTVALGAAIERADREGLPLSVALLDLDHFKTINDVNGHAEGDRVLAEVATLLKSHFAAAGMAARYGGEEFAVLMPDTALDQARLQCEFLRQGIAVLPVGIVVSGSLGVAQYRPGETAGEAIARADEALYRAKRGGRDRVEAAD